MRCFLLTPYSHFHLVELKTTTGQTKVLSFLFKGRQTQIKFFDFLFQFFAKKISTNIKYEKLNLLKNKLNSIVFYFFFTWKIGAISCVQPKPLWNHVKVLIFTDLVHFHFPRGSSDEPTVHCSSAADGRESETSRWTQSSIYKQKRTK